MTDCVLNRSSSARGRQLNRHQDYFDTTVMSESFGRVLKHAMVTGDHSPCPVRILRHQCMCCFALSWTASSLRDNYCILLAMQVSRQKSKMKEEGATVEPRMLVHVTVTGVNTATRLKGSGLSRTVRLSRL